MNLGRWCFALLVALAVPCFAHAGTFELDISNHLFQGWFLHDVGTDPDGRLQLGGRYLYDNQNADKTNLGAFIIGMAGELRNVKGLQFFLGSEVFFGKGYDKNVNALTVGARAQWAPVEFRGAYVGGRIFWAPSVFSSNDTDGMWDLGVEGGYKITPRIDLFVGFQKVEAKFKSHGSENLSDGFLFGFRGTF